MAFFGFGAFNSPVGQLVEKATDNAASAGNLALHLEICDTINESDNGPKEAVAAIRKRLTSNSKNFHIINLTLTVLETCVKNCGIRFHSKIATKEFLSDLLKVIALKNNPPTIVKERVLGLIQYWADAFKGKPSLGQVSELYEQMKSEGVEFPPIDLDNLTPVDAPGRQQPLTLSQPVEQPPRASPSSSRARAPAVPRGPLKPEQVAKLLSELDIVRKNMDIMNEIMTEFEPGKESAEDAQLLEDLNKIVHSMQERVASLIAHCSDEIVLESTLVINDELNALFVRYERFSKNSTAAKQQGREDTLVSSTGIATTALTEPSGGEISYPSLDDPPAYQPTEQLIDLGDPVPPPQDDIVGQLAQLGVTAPPTTTATGDAFDIFSQSRTAYSTASGSTYADNMANPTGSVSAAVHGHPGNQNPYSDLSDWLANTDLKSEQPAESATNTATTATNNAESATSAEFDQFLAARATKGEALPRSRPQMQQQQETRTDELFQL